MKALVVAVVLALAFAAPASADPIITPLVAAGVGALIGETVVVGSFTLGGILTSVVSSALVLGGLFGAEKLLARPRGQQPSFGLPPGPVPFETQGQAIAGRFYTYGVDRLGGLYCFRESNGLTLGYGVVIGCRPVEGVEGYFIDDELPAMNSGGVGQAATNPTTGVPYMTTVDYGPDVLWPTSGQKWTNFYSYIYVPNPKGGGERVPYVMGSGPVGFVEFRNATDAGVASTLLKSDFPALWDDAHACRGLSMLYSRWQAIAIAGGREAHYPRLFPVHSTVLRGARVFDPRDATQSFLDPVTGQYSVYNPTWKYSANNALCIADFLTFPEAFGYGYDDINWSTFIQAANDCDRFVSRFGDAPEPFARCHLTWAATEERRDVLNRMLAACDGQLYEDNNGKICLWIGQWEDATVTFGTADISSLQIETTAGVYAESNYVQVTYVEPRTNFSKNTSIVVTDDASIAEVGERQSTIDLSAVHSFSQAYRLATRAMRRQNTPQKITLTGGPRLLLADGQRVVALDCPEYGIAGTFRVLAMTAQSLANISLTLALVTPDMFEDVVPPFDPVNGSLPGVVQPEGFTPSTPTIETAFGTVSGTTGTVAASVNTPTGAGDAQCIAYFRSRPVDPATHATLGDGHWTIWGDALSQFSAKSPAVTGVAGVPQCFEVQAWLVSTQGVAGPTSASSFVTLAF